MTLWTLLVVTSLQANQNPFHTKLPFKEGIIHYAITGSQTGSQITYIKDYGKKRLIYRKSYDKIMHADNLHETLIMITPEWTYSVNLHNKEAIKTSTLQHLLEEEFEGLTDKEQENILAHTSSIQLGFPCISLPISGTVTEFTKEGHLALFSKTNILGYSVQTRATKIEIKALDKNIFDLPKEMKVREQEADFGQVTHILESLID